MNEDWRDRAACLPPKNATSEERETIVSIMFPPVEAKDDSFEVLRAKQVCEPCPVKAPCLAFALMNKEPEGVWGGTTLKERKRLIREARRRRIAQESA